MGYFELVRLSMESELVTVSRLKSPSNSGFFCLGVFHGVMGKIIARAEELEGLTT